MKANFRKRLGAYLIDIFLFGILISVVSILFGESQNYQMLQNELNTLNEEFLNHSISSSVFITRFASISKDIDKELVMYSVINAFFLLGYFVITPYFFQGQTIGKSIFKIRVERKDKELLSLNDLLIRSFFNDGLLTMLVSLSFVYILPAMPYFIVTSIFSFFQFFLVIVSVFMIIYRKDKRGLADIFSKTRVIEVKK